MKTENLNDNSTESVKPVEIQVQTDEDGGLEKLTKKEAEELQKQEAVVEKHIADFWKAALALKAIHDGRLYKATHKTFRDYCLERWQFDRAHGDRMVRAAGIYDGLKCLQGGDIPLPISEAQVRPLTRISPDKQEEVWKKAVAAAKAEGKPVTMSIVEAEAEKEREKKPQRKVKNGQAAVVEKTEPKAVVEEETEEEELKRLATRMRELLRGVDDLLLQDALLTVYAHCKVPDEESSAQKTIANN